MDSTLGVLCAAAFLDLFGVSMMTMHLPNYMRQLGASHTTVGYIGSIYGFVQLFSSPLIGSYADIHSKRSMLLFSIITCAFGYISLGASSSLWSIALLRVYLGIFKHPLNLLKSALSDLTAGKSSTTQSQVQGYYQSACSLAFIVSPPIAGYLIQMQHGYFVIGVCVAVVYMVNAALIWVSLPTDIQLSADSNPSGNSSIRKSSSDGKSHNNSNSRSNWRALSIPDVNRRILLLMLTACFLQSFSAMVWRNSYSMLYRELYHLTPPQIGWLISFNGCVQTSIGFLVKYISMIIPKSLHQLIISCVLYIGAMITLANTSHSYYLYMMVLPMSTAAMLGKVSYQSYVNQTVGKGHSAYLIGITGSINSFCRLSTPIVVGYIMDKFDMSLTLYCSALCTTLAALLYMAVEYAQERDKTKSD